MRAVITIQAIRRNRNKVIEIDHCLTATAPIIYYARHVLLPKAMSDERGVRWLKIALESIQLTS